MNKWLWLLSYMVFTAPAWAQLRVSPTTVSTGLRWDNLPGAAANYKGISITVTGNRRSVTWEIKDQNGTVISTLSAGGSATLGWPAKGGTPPDHTAVFGQIDCKGSADNTACIYNAPGEYPPGETAMLNATDGTSSAAVAVRFSFAHNLQEYFKHRARMLGFQAKPFKKLEIASKPLRYQPELLIFQSAPLPDGKSYEYHILQDDNDVRGAGFPATGGSMVNRPSWSYDGKWFSWTGARCLAAVWCGSSGGVNMIVQTDGSNLQPLLNLPFNSKYTFGYNQPNWLITSDPSHLDALDLADAQALTPVATYSSAQFRRIYSQVSRQYAEFKESNQPRCQPVSPACSVNVFIYDLSGCETKLQPGCASIFGQWNINMNLTFGWDAQGKQHCTIEGGGFNCEWHNHDMWLLRNTTNTVWGYGPGGDVGEGIQYMTDANGKDTIALIPNAERDTPYLSHPAVNWSGELAAYGGQQRCQPSGRACMNNTWGSGIWDFRQNKAVVYYPGTYYAHGAWDGFDNNHFGHDGHGGGTCPASHWCLQSSTIDYQAGTIQDTTVLDFGTRARGRSGEPSFGVLYGPSQSPDATKLAQSMPTGFSAANQALGWIVVVRKPAPPVDLRLASAGSATIRWRAAELNHEAKAYHIYKQPNCLGSWQRLADVEAVYLQQTPYTYTDRGIAQGQSACYGITTEEWTGTESQGLSEVLKITHAGATLSGQMVAEAGTTGFDRTTSAPATNFRAAREPLPEPEAPYSVAQAKGGSLPDGAYSVRLAFCNFADFPANTVAAARCTAPGPARRGTIADGHGSGALAIVSQNFEAYGQIAVHIYACGPEPFKCPETLQTTVTLPVPPNARPGQLIYTLKTMSAGGAAPSASQPLVGYRLNWAAPPDNDVRYFALYSRDDQPPPLLRTDAYQAQQYLIATLPASYTSYLDYLLNWAEVYKGSGGPYYGIVAVDREGNRSTPVCLRADTGANVACN